MKNKRIVITYLKTGDVKSEIAKEMMFDKVVDDLVAEGRVISQTTLLATSKRTVFEDGTRVELYPFSESLRASRATHVFVDNTIKSLTNGTTTIQTVIFPLMMIGEYEHFDTSGKQLSYFEYDNGKIKLT
jgi:hypothetical protein